MGGAQTILLSLIRSLPRDQYEIVVLPYDTGSEPDTAFARAAAEAGARLTTPLKWNGWRTWNDASRTLVQIVDRYGIDMIHSHDNMSNTLVAFNRSRLRKPAIATAFGWWELNAKLKAYYAFERRFVLPRFDAVYTVSHQMAGKIISGGTSPERIAVIHTGLDPALWSPRGNREASRSALGLDPDALVVGAVGRVSPEKGHDHLLRAIALLRPEFPNVVVFLGGTGPDVQRLKELANELGLPHQLIMPGYVASAPDALEALDVAVLPSILEEGFPTASMEAQAMGLPIVASDIGGTSETIVPETTGFLCRPGDPAALAAALKALLADRSLRQRMGAAARRRVMEDFTKDAMVQKLCSLYRSTHDVASS